MYCSLLASVHYYGSVFVMYYLFVSKCPPLWSSVPDVLFSVSKCSLLWISVRDVLFVCKQVSTIMERYTLSPVLCTQVLFEQVSTNVEKCSPVLCEQVSPTNVEKCSPVLREQVSPPM
eukprot:TRINITY_DN142637_c0_g1_i2.p1 TRINITY_DN142637_c0_g1~~TRINITY_DN142637_c0_g1_i2.p1  ORF type:complete len:118 (+),score=9.50 TRINITY_DN142637_c0_g1_i2:123-476(+)